MMLRVLTVLGFLGALALGALMPAQASAHLQADGGCAHEQAEAGAMVHPEAPVVPDQHGMPDCCSGAGLCRMASCATALIVQPVMPVVFRARSYVFFTPEPARLDGREVPPPEGPPRSILI